MSTRSGRSVAEVGGPGDIPGLRPFINRGGASLLHVLNKVATWGAWDGEYIPGYTPRPLIYLKIGDSTGAGGFWDSQSGVQHVKGVMRELAESAIGNPSPFSGSYSTTGTTWQADGTVNPYNYELHPQGTYYSSSNGSTRKTTSAGPYSGAFFPYILEDEALGVGGGTGTFELRNNSASTAITVNGVTASISFDADAGASPADPYTFKKCGFLYFQIDASDPTAGQFKLTINNYGSTANVAYNASAATLQSAIEAIDARLVGKVGVSLSGTTYTVLIVLDDALGVNGIEWSHGTTPLTAGGTTARLLLKMTVGSAWTTMHLAITSGIVRHHGFRGWDITVDGVIFLSQARGGARLGNFVKFDPVLAAAFYADLQPDFVSVAWTHYQLGSETPDPVGAPTTHTAFTEAQLEQFVGDLFDLLESGWTKFNLIWQSPNPHYQDTGDADLIAAVNFMQPYIEDTRGYHFLNCYEVLGGYADLLARDSAVNTFWTGDGVHLGPAYTAAAAQLLMDQYGLGRRWAGGRNQGPLRTRSLIVDEVLFQAGDQLLSGVYSRIHTNNQGLDLFLQPIGNNHDVIVQSNGGSTVWRLSTYTSNRYIPTGTRLGATTGGYVGATGVSSVSIAGGAGTTSLTDEQTDVEYIELTGALTGNRVAALKSRPGKSYLIYNNTTGAFTVTVQPSGGSGITVTQGKKVRVQELAALDIVAIGAEF